MTDQEFGDGFDLEIPSSFDAEGRLRLECWYCGKEVAYEGFDPCALILVTNWGSDEAAPREQQFFAHADCFRKSGSGKYLYIFEEDFEAE